MKFLRRRNLTLKPQIILAGVLDFIFVWCIAALHHVVLYCKSMLMEHERHIQGKPQPIHHALVYVLTHMSGTGQDKLWLRTQVASEIKKILQSLGGEQTALALLEDLSTYLEAVNVKVSFFFSPSSPPFIFLSYIVAT